MQDDRITAVIDDLSSLILDHAGLMAHEQYAPRADADQSDEAIAAHAEWVKELRDIRQRFENLVTGIL